MTPTEAREMALLCFADHRNALWSLADQVEALTKERDSLAVCYEAREEEAHQLSERIIKLTKERDAFKDTLQDVRGHYERVCKERDEYAKAADSMAMQHKVERDALAAEVVRLDAGWHKANGDTLDKALELDKVKAAAKLALDALVAESRTTESNVTLVRILTAITSLRQAGVQ